MTRFRRSAHYRTSKYGYTYYVSEHDVDRYDWEQRGAGQKARRYRDQLAALRAYSGTTAAFVNPNAKCPVCGVSVFYYQNEHGSRVFFDELGPPWPKHPCTDEGPYQSARFRMDNFGPTTPVVRDSNERDLIDRFRRELSIDRRRDFRGLYKATAPVAAQVRKRLRAHGSALLILEPLGNQATTIFASCRALPKNVREGSVVFLSKARLSVFDSSTMQPKEISMKRVRGAASFVKHWLGDGSRHD
jgi:hypothetical protein